MNIILSKVVLWGKSSFHYMEYRTFPEIAAQSFATNSICYNHEIEKNHVSKILRITSEMQSISHCVSCIMAYL